MSEHITVTLNGEASTQRKGISVRELIRERVYQEVDDYNRAQRDKKATTRYLGLVKPSELETDLNGPMTKRAREVDWKKQFDLATEAYENKRILVLVGDHQTETLDEEIDLSRNAEVTFLRLVLLVGG